LETDRFRGAAIVVVKQWGIGKQMCKKTGTVLRRNDNEGMKNIFCFVNLMYDDTYFLGSIKLREG